jgi:coenzyme F420-reducing hydrogenase delta subunit/ferredoxin
MLQDTHAPASQAAWEPRIAGLVCNWCTYAGADMAGTTRRAYPASVRMIRVPCTGRMDPLLIIKAFEQGADGLIVSGCHPGDCHYVQGNLVARRRFTALKALLEFLGLDSRRVHFAWVSASEGLKWAKLVDEVTTAVREAGPFREWGQAGAAKPVKLPAVPAAPRPAPAIGDQQAIANHLQRLAASLLESGRVAAVIGYRPGTLPGQTVPSFVTTANDAASLTWTDRCVNNLSVYLPNAVRQWKKVAVVVKTCDMRAAVGLLQENQITRDDVVLIGVSCDGVWEEKQLALKCYACSGEVGAPGDFTVTPRGAESGVVASGAKRAVAVDPRDALVEHLAAQPPAERWAYWQAQFAHCVRCYGCRAACPLCYCAVCVAEKNRPQWVPVSIDGKGNTAWNITRAFHLAGRCGSCDECSRVCPADVRLDLLNHRLAMEIDQRYGYRAGQDPAIAPPLATFRPEDPQEFIH